MSLKRVFHPSLNAWQDVPEGDIQSWKDAGWRMTKPDHVDLSGAAPVGEALVTPPVAVVVDTTPPAPEPAPAPANRAPEPAPKASK